MSKTDFPALMFLIERDIDTDPAAAISLESLSMLVSAKLCMAINGNDRDKIISCLLTIRDRLTHPENISFINKTLATTWPDARITARYRDMMVADRKTFKAMQKDGLF